jgi:hypothetical protein
LVVSSSPVVATSVGAQIARKKSWDGAKMMDKLKRLVFESEGMEVVDWSILAMVVAAAVLLWSMRKHEIDVVRIDTVLGDLGACLENSTRCG